MTRNLFIVILLMTVCVLSAYARGSAAGTQKAKAVAIYAPPPDFPIEARERRLTGSGVALLYVDPRTGEVTSVRMEKSMGHAMLDQAALAAFSRWRFKPGCNREIHIPIRYTIGKKT
jgi:TonB family protein